ncbi:MAG TPA: MarR family transcriptional regulator [Acidimicrobiales bacterium]
MSKPSQPKSGSALSGGQRKTGESAADTDPIEHSRQSWVEHGWGDPEVMSVVASIVRSRRLLSTMIDTALRPLDLTYTRFEALGLLYFSPTGELPLGKISERLQVRPATITSVVDRLEKQGLLRRTRPDGDRRVTLATITPAGRAIVEKATTIIVDDVFSAMPWSKGELKTLFDLLAQLRHQAGDFS